MHLNSDLTRDGCESASSGWLALDAAGAAALAARIREMPDAIARYKNIAPVRASLLAWLDDRAAAHGAAEVASG